MIQNWIDFANSWRGETAVVFGMFFQFFLSPQKNFRIFIFIIMSSTLIAVYFMPVIVEAFKIEKGGDVAMLLATLSSLLSMQIVSIVITVVPPALENKLKKYLGIEEEEDDATD